MDMPNKPPAAQYGPRSVRACDPKDNQPYHDQQTGDGNQPGRACVVGIGLSSQSVDSHSYKAVDHDRVFAGSR